MKNCQFISLSFFLLLTSFSVPSLSHLSNIKNYNSVRITELIVNDYPERKPNSQSWDPMGGDPDIYFNISFQQKRNVSFESGVFQNVMHHTSQASHTSISWGDHHPDDLLLPASTFTLHRFSQVIYFNFYDRDSQGLNLSNDDYIGTVSFSPNDYISTYPSYVIISQNGLRVRLELEWN